MLAATGILGHDLDLPWFVARVADGLNGDFGVAIVDDGFGGQAPRFAAISGFGRKAISGTIGAGLEEQLGLAEVAFGVELSSRACFRGACG